MNHKENPEQINNLERSVGRIEGKLDGILEQLKKINGSIGEQDRRIDTLEQESARAKGIAAGISIVVSAAIAVINHLLKK
jgi:peptidoglycan hydrolase CwlO-like protein